jgi:ribonucleoside-triphosphate reductase
MRERIMDFQLETGNLYNLEATPAEGVSYRFAKHDTEKFPDIVTAGKNTPYYTNSVHLPVGYTDDVFDVLDHQDELQSLFTGGTVVHCFVGEKVDDPHMVKKLVRKIAENYSIPYFTITPTFSICPVHGYIGGAHKYCPHEHSEEDLVKYGMEIPAQDADYDNRVAI